MTRLNVSLQTLQHDKTEIHQIKVRFIRKNDEIHLNALLSFKQGRGGLSSLSAVVNHTSEAYLPLSTQTCLEQA